MAGPASSHPFTFNPALDPEDVGRRFARCGRVQIADFLLPASAQRLRDYLVARSDWRHVVNGTDRVFEIPALDYDKLPADQIQALDRAVFAAAATGFQFRYDTIRVPDEDAARRRSATLLDKFARFMSGRQVLDFLRRATGIADIAFADAQATRYRPGDFLTRHDDDVAGKHRRLAYVMSLSPDWRAEWGGLLVFAGAGGSMVEAVVPRFNALSLFAVPQPHSVSYVAPYAPEPRISVTGWLRAERP